MKWLFSLILIFFLIFVNISPVLAQAVPTPPIPQVQFTNEFTVEKEPSVVITLLKGFIEGFDSFLGGFIFYTPNPLGETITLRDKSEIPGVTKYRDLFNQIAIPTVAIIIAALAISKIGSDNAQKLKSFAFRFLITIVLFIAIPYVLNYSIQANNLLVESISKTQTFTGFLNTYFDKAQDGINNNEPSEKYGIPTFDISMKAGVFRSLGKFIVQIFLFAITFLFLLGSFIYLGFQFVIRFATLLFLGVLYPIAIPFVLAEKTEGILLSFLKIWFTLLIQQPAFLLGFAMTTDIFSSILTAKGPSVGLLFFYTGFLFFLGGVNSLVAHLFGEVWVTASTNVQAAVSNRTVTGSVKSYYNQLKGPVRRSISALRAQGNESDKTAKPDPNKTEKPKTNGKVPNHYASNSQPPKIFSQVGTQPSPSPFAKELAGRGLDVNLENHKQGVVSLSGDAYRYQDKAAGLSSIYPTRSDAVQDGVSEANIQKIKLNNEQFIDLSTFGNGKPNPHNVNAVSEASKRGKYLNYAYLKPTSPPSRIKNFLAVSKERNEAFGIKGVIVKRQAKQGADNIVRIYSDKL